MEWSSVSQHPYEEQISAVGSSIHALTASPRASPNDLPFPSPSPDGNSGRCCAIIDVTGACLFQMVRRHADLNVNRIALAFENLTPIQVCQAFERALSRPCKYVFNPHIEVKVNVPHGYRQQLSGVELLFGHYNAPYFPGPEFDYSSSGSGGKRQDSGDTITANSVKGGGKRRSSETIRKEGRPKRLTQEARELWAGYRGIEEYAREVFPVEEEANGKTWMRDKVQST